MFKFQNTIFRVYVLHFPNIVDSKIVTATVSLYGKLIVRRYLIKQLPTPLATFSFRVSVVSNLPVIAVDEVIEHGFFAPPETAGPVMLCFHLGNAVLE